MFLWLYAQKLTSVLVSSSHLSRTLKISIMSEMNPWELDALHGFLCHCIFAFVYFPRL